MIMNLLGPLFRDATSVYPTKGGKSYIILCFSMCSSVGSVFSRQGLPEQYHRSGGIISGYLFSPQFGMLEGPGTFSLE